MFNHPAMNKSKVLWGILILTVLGVFLWFSQVIIMAPSISFGDEGIIAQAARRILKGEIPCRDFYVAISPGSYYWASAFLFVFGKTFLSLRLSILVVFIMMLICVFFVLYKLSVRSILIYIFTLFFMVFICSYWFIVSHHWISLFFCLLSLLFLIDNEENNTNKIRGLNFFMAGVFASFAIFSMQYKGILWVVAVSLAIFKGQPVAFRFFALKKFLYGVLVVTIPFAILFIYLVGFDSLFYQLIVFPLTQYHNLPDHKKVTLIKSLLKNWGSISASISTNATIMDYLKYLTWYFGLVGRIIVIVLPFFGLLSLYFLRKKKLVNRGNFYMLTAFLVTIYLSTAYRIHENTLFFASTAGIIAVILAIDRFFKQNISKTNKRFVSVVCIFFVCLFGYVSISSSLLYYILPSYSANTAAGVVKSQFEDEAQALQGVSSFMKQNLKKGEPIFCFSYNPLFYFLLDADNPTRLDTITFPMHTQEQLDQVQASLDKVICRWVVWDYTTFSRDTLGHYLRENYELRTKYSNVAILQRRE